MSHRDLNEDEKIRFELMIEDLRKIFEYEEILAEDIPDLISELKSDEVMDYIDSLSKGSKPESALREAFFAGRSLISKFFGGTSTPEVNLGNGFIDYILRVDGRYVLIELKSLFEPVYESGKTRRVKSLKKREMQFERHKEQVLRYLREGSEYIILTDLKDWYFFNRKVNPTTFTCFSHFELHTLIEEYQMMGDFWDFLRRQDEQSIKEDLDKEFFESLKIWVTKLSEIEFETDEQIKIEHIIRLLNKFIFIQTLDDFYVIDARWIKTNWDEMERKWKAKGQLEVLEQYFKEINEWFFKYYDTDLFRDSVLDHIKKDEKNIEKLYNSLQLVLGVTGWQTTFRGIAGIMQYNFRFIDEDIFGKAYETFLAEVRHDEGIYYTPKYITRYIVDTTVGNTFDNIITDIESALEKDDFTTTQALIKKFISIRVLDPACGSGSFLIKAVRTIMEKYRYLKNLLDELHSKYNKFNGSLVRPKEVEEKAQRIRSLINTLHSRNERDLISRLLVRHIHGNDLDRKALEVAKVNIWLEAIKLAPHEFRFDKLPKETNHILPNLGMNLVNGDSVVGLPDESVIQIISSNHKKELKELFKLRNMYLEDPTQPELVDKIEEIKVIIRREIDNTFIKYLKENDISEELIKETRPFHWPIEFWFTVFIYDKELQEQKQWFDVVIGNPPYIDSETMTKTNPYVRDFCSKKYDSASGNWDMFCVFLEIGLIHISKDGKFGYIIPNKVLGADYADATRSLLKKYTIENLRDYSKVKVFDASVYPIVMIVNKQQPTTGQIVTVEVLSENENGPTITHSDEISLEGLYSMSNNIWSPILDPTVDVFNKIVNSSPNLNQYFEIVGAATVSEAYEISDKLMDGDDELNADELKFINTGTIDKYISLWGYKPTQYIKRKYKKPRITNKDLEKISIKRLQQSKSDKVIVIGMGIVLEALFDCGEYLAGKSTSIIMLRDKDLNLKALSGVINSIANTFVLRRFFDDLSLSGGYMRIGPPQLKRLPIPISYINNEKERNVIELLVEQIMLFKKHRLMIIELWNHWSTSLKNSERLLIDILKNDLQNIQEGKFDDVWTSYMTYSPIEKHDVFLKYYNKFNIIGNINDLNIKIYGIDERNNEEFIYELIFNDKYLWTHVYFSILTLLDSRKKVKTLYDIFNRTKILVIQPDIIISTKNIINKLYIELDKILKKENIKNDIPIHISIIDNEISNLEAQIDARVFKLYGLKTEEINMIMDSIEILTSYRKRVLMYLK